MAPTLLRSFMFLFIIPNFWHKIKCFWKFFIVFYILFYTFLFIHLYFDFLCKSWYNKDDTILRRYSMNFTVKTTSGSVYEFTHKDGHTFFRKGLLSGEVIRIKNGPITVGKGISMDFYKDNLYGTRDKFPMFINTTAVTEIKITL